MTPIALKRSFQPFFSMFSIRIARFGASLLPFRRASGNFARTNVGDIYRLAFRMPSKRATIP